MVGKLRLAILHILFSVVSVASGCVKSYQGAVRGRIADKQGAAVPNVQVNLTNESTSITRVSVTNSDGQYLFTAVEPATYTISIVATGFKKVERKSIAVGTQQFLTLDFHLEIGSIDQSVEVTSARPLGDVSNASNGQVFDTHKLENLPAPIRNPYLFERLDNNVVNASTVSGNSKFSDQTGVSNVSIAGGPPAANNYLIDGVPITDVTHRSEIIPPLEAIKEVSLQANTYDAEVRRTGGGPLSPGRKPGANTLHEA